jgi:zeaxanthin glucosyltransferase
MHFGVISPPVPGHIHPFGALGRELIARGHRVTFFQMADVEAWARAEGLEFACLGQQDHPAGSLPVSLRELGRLQGMAALRFTIQAVKKTTEMICRDAPAALRDTGIEMLLVDQMEPAGGAVAEYLGIPFVTVCNALALNRESSVPPPFTDWSWGPQWWRRARNTVGYRASDRMLSPVTGVVRSYRRQWGLPAHNSPEDSFSRLAQISQLPPAFDYPRQQLPATFHYVGPLRRGSARDVPFPWHELNGKPLVYASLGTLQQSKTELFRCFAEACAGLPVQLALTHCGGLTVPEIRQLPGNPIVVDYAPQEAVLSRAAVTLTHAGLNTVLDSLAHGVPMVAVPITYEQPATAERLRWSGAGQVASLTGLTADKLRAKVEAVRNNSSYADNAARVARSVSAAGGVTRAADIIEHVIEQVIGTVSPKPFSR